MSNDLSWLERGWRGFRRRPPTISTRCWTAWNRCEEEAPMTGHKQIIRPYGDRRDDGVVQLSFTLPVPLSEKAKEAAAQFVHKMGFSDVKVAAAEPAADNYTFFVVYARSGMYIDYADIDVPEVVVRKLGFDELNRLIEEKIGRRVVVLGACTGTDTHTVGIDAILNMKGYSGDYGLERYPWFQV